MLINVFFVFLLAENVSRFTYGQSDLKFFRKDYTYIEDTENFYKVHTLGKNWMDAKELCEKEGATFFYPDDDDEALVVLAHWNATQPFLPQVYIGIADWNVREVFETVDGRPITDVYDNWGFGEPNNANELEGCVILRRDGTLNDVNCNDKYQFICKKTLATLEWNVKCNMPDPRYEYNEYSTEMGRCYKFHLTPKNWTEAYITCKAEQSYLAIINSEAERALLVSITAKAPIDTVVGNYLRGGVHLGFRNDKRWITVKGVPLSESGYSKWAYGQPDGGDLENCGSMFFNGELNDIGCFQKMFFVCEHEVQIRGEDIVYKFGEDEDPIKSIFGTPK